MGARSLSARSRECDVYKAGDRYLRTTEFIFALDNYDLLQQRDTRLVLWPFYKLWRMDTHRTEDSFVTFVFLLRFDMIKPSTRSESQRKVRVRKSLCICVSILVFYVMMCFPKPALISVLVLSTAGRLLPQTKREKMRADGGKEKGSDGAKGTEALLYWVDFVHITCRQLRAR